MEEATFLTRFASRVHVVHRRDELRASKIMQDRARANEKISFAWHSEVTDVLGEQTVSGVRLADTRSGDTRDLPVTGLFLAIGHDPRSSLVEGQLKLDDEGYVVVEAPGTATSLPGVFAAGDVVDKHYRQAVTAAGTGCAAALDAERWLAEQGDSATDDHGAGSDVADQSAGTRLEGQDNVAAEHSSVVAP
jgi:thioredoxin reductase (NADPH)